VRPPPAPGLVIFSVLAVACGGGDAQPCNAMTNLGCVPALQCETVQGLAQPTCLPPVVLRGHVRDSSTLRAVAGARVVAFDATGAPLAAATTTGADGGFAFRLRAPRDAAFKPLAQPVSVAAAAAGFGNFPDRWRAAAPVDLASAVPTATKEELVATGPGTEVTLFPFGGGPGIGVLSGTVPLPAPAQQVLVVATADQSFGGVGISGLADAAGAYTLFGLPPATYVVRALAAGRNYLDVPIAIPSGTQATLDLRADPTPASRVSGRLDVAGTATSRVALFVASTFVAGGADGDQPPGLLTTAGADGSFSFAGVPAGRWAVVASPDNDGLARVGAPAFVDVEAGKDVALAAAIRVAPAVRLLGPGADHPEALAVQPTLSWVDVGSEESYHVSVTSAVGVVVWEIDLPRGTTSVPYPRQLAPGSWYRFQVTALDLAGRPLAQSEDLTGIFYSSAQQG
jgi:hypothetical protein